MSELFLTKFEIELIHEKRRRCDKFKKTNKSTLQKTKIISFCLSEDEETIEKMEAKPEEKEQLLYSEIDDQEIENKEPRNSHLVTSKSHFARNSIFNKQSKSICEINITKNFPLMDIELPNNGPFKVGTKGMPNRKEVRSIKSLNSQ